MTTSLAVLVDAVGRVLNGAESDSGPGRQSWSDDTISLARVHRLEGFFVRHREQLALDGGTVDKLLEGEQRRAQQALTQWSHSVRLSRLLEQHKVPHLVFKGRALTLHTEADDEGRGGGDVDVLVPPEFVPACVGLLEAEGFRRVYAIQPSTRWGWRFVTYRNREMPFRSQSIEIDLHWRVASEESLLPPATTLIARSVRVGREGQDLPTLQPTDALAASAFHFFFDKAWSLRRLVDFVRLTRGSDQGVLSTMPPGGQQLVADVAGFCRELFGPRCVSELLAIRSTAENIDQLRALFWSSGEGRLFSSDGALARFSRNYRHLSRYAPQRALMLRLIARGSVWFPPYRDGRGVGLIRAFGYQLLRVFRGKFDSQV